ncbi:MAG: LamG-like jellyroll fold domain-containing protein, partial [Limisphaerales bacterium]
LGFEEASGVEVANGGTGGDAWNGFCVGGAALGAAGPRPPGFRGLPADNRALSLDGVGGYLGTRAKLPRGLGQFTMGGWLHPKSLRSKASFAFGVDKALSVTMSASRGRTQVTVHSRRSPTLTWQYLHGLDTWHHVVVVGTGVALQLYVDGILVASKKRTASEYSFDGGHYFTVGGQAGKRSTTSQNPFHGLLDEIVLYDRALSSADVLKLYGGEVTLATGADIPPQSWTALADGFDVVAAE